MWVYIYCQVVFRQHVKSYQVNGCNQKWELDTCILVQLGKLLGTTYTHTHKMEEINNKEMHPGAIALYTQK